MAIALRIEPRASTTAKTRPITMSEKYSAGPKTRASFVSGTPSAAIMHGRDAAGEERADRRDAERDAGPALARHLVAVEHGDDRGRLARDVDQDRRRRAAVLRAVVDAGEHDQRADRIEAEGDRQQDGDGGDRPDAGQHADQRADQAADEAEPRFWSERATEKPSPRLLKISDIAPSDVDRGAGDDQDRHRLVRARSGTGRRRTRS